MIPMTIPAALAACDAAYAGLGEEDAMALSAALAHPSPVNRLVGAFDVLRAVSAPSEAALIALAGCAKMIASHGFSGWSASGAVISATDATDLLIQRGAEIAALAPPSPDIDLPVPEAINDLT